MDELERFVRAGGGWVGVHAASDTEFDAPFYGELIGGDAWFDGHPAIQDAAVTIEDPEHVSTSHYAETTFTRTDEWYDFRANPRDAVHVLATVDESTYDGGGMGEDHPIAWCHTVGAGRSFYTGMGHTKESWEEPDFLAHVAGGIAYAAGADAPCT
jgi:type 1 glutamine amidotransferase